MTGRKLQDCGSWLHLREWIQSGESKLIHANFCKKFLLCPCCARRRVQKQLAAYVNKVEAVIQERKNLIPAMVTVTVKNGDDLAERLAHFKASWSRMSAAKRRGKSDKAHDGKIEWNKVHGSLRTIEIKKGKGGKGWHPHGHAFVLLDDYLDQEKLSEEWNRFTGDSFVVDVRKCRDGIMPGLVEVMKYVTKFDGTDPVDLWQIYQVAGGSRFFDPQGALRGVPEPDIDSDDIKGMVGPWRDFMALWNWHQGGYALIDIPDDRAPFPKRPQIGPLAVES